MRCTEFCETRYDFIIKQLVVCGMFYRYKPFFNKTDPGQLDIDDYEIVPQGVLEITCVELSRLYDISDVMSVYCTFTIGKHLLIFYK